MAEEKSKRSPSENFADMMKEFGRAVAEIFNDPKLKEKAKEFGDSAAASAKVFADRFKDEEVKNKFKDLGNTAKNFGESVADYFKDDKKESSEKPDPNAENSNAETDESKKKFEDIAQASSSEVKSPTVVLEKESSSFKEDIRRDRNARITGYSFAIAWSIIFLIFFNFFNKYIAYYVYNTDSKTWDIFPFVTDPFNVWLPILNASILATIIGNIILIINDSFYFNNITNIIMHLFGIVSVSALFVLFPFDFSVVPDMSLNSIIFPIIKIILILIIAGLSIGVLVRFIKVIVKSVRIS